ncbi:MAG: hypothetical protein JWO02_4156 [Solirubrobacterales bacterium]|nr:hypothetical protein [Solirubrobacterales bacterium]
MSTPRPPHPLADALLGTPPPHSDDPELERLLDVAMQEMAHFGFARTSLNDIARKAGVSRPTAYRRLGNKDLLIRRLLLREAESFFAELETAVDGIAGIELRAAEAFVVGLRTARAHPLVARLLVSEPEAILPPLTGDGAPVILMMRGAIAHYLDPEGNVDADDLARASEMLVRLAASFLLTPSDLFDAVDEDAMRELARGCVTAAISAGRVRPAQRRRKRPA